MLCECLVTSVVRAFVSQFVCVCTLRDPDTADNPFPNSGQPTIWVYGIRNLYTFSFEAVAVAPRMFLNDVGQDSWEEINVGIAAANYGWPDSEGPTALPGHTSPLFAYNHTTDSTQSCAITGA